VLILDGEALLHLAENVRPDGFTAGNTAHQAATPALELV